MHGKAGLLTNKHFYLFCGIAVAVVFWFFDSSVHYFGYGESEFEFIPSEFNELWMRTTIIVLLIAFGRFADYHAARVRRKQAEKLDVYLAMLSANQHILNNFLQNMLVFKMEAERSSDFSRERLEMYDQVIEDTRKQIRALEGIDDPNRDNIEEKFRLY